MMTMISTPMMTVIGNYLLAAMLAWAPASSMPGRDVSHYPSIASDIADVVLSEPPLWADDASHGRTAILVTAIAFWESHFWRHVDDGRCNDYTWRKTKVGRALLATTGDCDGGLAGSLWQVHALGIVLTDAEYTYSDKGLSTADLIADRKLAARVALHILRKSLRMSGTLCGYSGEAGPCPKANVRQRFAENWSHKHPYE